MATDREAEIARLHAACGCKESLIAFALGLCAYLLFPEWFPQGESALARVLIGGAIALASAVTGKVLALLVVQWRLRRLLRESRSIARGGWPAI